VVPCARVIDPAATRAAALAGSPVRWWVRVALSAAAGALCIAAFRVVRRGLALVAYPFAVDYGEGSLLVHAARYAAGGALYPEGLAPPWIANNYPPVYYALVRLLGGGGDLLATGRAVSLVSALLLAVAAALLAARLAPRDARPRIRAAGALFAGAALLALPPVHRWSGLARIDFPAHLLGAAGLLAFVTARRDWTRVALSAPLLLAAGFTRQSAVAAALGCLAAAALVRRRLALALAAALGVPAAALLALAHATTGGAFLAQVVGAANNAYEPARAVAGLGRALSRAPVLYAAGVAAAALAVSAALRARRARAAPEERERALPTLAVSGATLAGLALALTFGKVGSNSNYFIELAFGAAVLCGAALAGALHRLAQPGASPRARQAAAALAVVLALQATAAGLLTRPIRPPPGEAPSHEAALARIRAERGPVLSEDLFLLVRAGREPIADPFVLAQLARQGLWDERPFLAELEAGRFPLVVLEFDADALPPAESAERFSAEARATIVRRYRLAERLGRFRLYRPAP
jgi:hypothetical protein